MSSCQQCGRQAAVTYGPICLCANHYGIWIADSGLSALGTVYDRERGAFRLPTDAEREDQSTTRASLAGPLAPSRGSGGVVRGSKPGASQTAGEAFMGGIARHLHPEERERLEKLAQSVPGGASCV